MKTDHFIPISLAEVRAIVLRSQGLAGDLSPFGSGKAAALKAIEHLGYVQVDTINVLQRAHHHVLWSRIPDYRPEMLHALQSKDGSVYEYWNHASSYLPTRDFRFSLPLMRKHRSQLHWSDPSPELTKSMKRLSNLIRKDGPLMISDVESKASTAGGWSDLIPGKIERRALHELWMRGEIMIRSRQGMQKLFDLPERVLPSGTNLELPKKDEATEFHIRRGLKALGVAGVRELSYLQDAARVGEGQKALLKMVKSGEAIALRVLDHPKMALYAFRDALKLASPVHQGVVRFLSPFDNVTIQRKRLKWLFGFDYVTEIYVPAAKRKYGYFVLPILWGDRLIGRMDAKADRTKQELLVHNLVFEPTFKQFNAVKPAIKEALRAFASFQQCTSCKISRIEPARELGPVF